MLRRLIKKQFLPGQIFRSSMVKFLVFYKGKYSGEIKVLVYILFAETFSA